MGELGKAGPSAGLDGPFDPIYFQNAEWSQRVSDWLAASAQLEFSRGNRDAVKNAISDAEAGLRVVVNIGTFALGKILADGGRYLNLYERPVIGDGPAKVATDERKKVDAALGLIDSDGEPDEHVYFGAVALGGVGVRYYGEYCMVLKLDAIDPDPQLFDRDSYDILLEPICSLSDPQLLIDRLRGGWQDDVQAMVEMKVLPELEHQRNVVTTGTVSELVLKDQEFIEVHLRPDQAGSITGEPRSFGAGEIEEIRESPDEVAVANRLHEREAERLWLSDEEHQWLERREGVSQAIGRRQITTRVVTQHGKGYQWK